MADRAVDGIGGTCSLIKATFMSIGMTKFYRVTCFKQIGGFVRRCATRVFLAAHHSLAMLSGCLRNWLKGVPRYGYLEFGRFLRSYQDPCFRFGKPVAAVR